MDKFIVKTTRKRKAGCLKDSTIKTSCRSWECKTLYSSAKRCKLSSDLSRAKNVNISPESDKGFDLRHHNGDLFDAPEESALAHCISADIAMGKGIATIFKRKFGGVEELKKQGKKIGEVAVLKRDNRFIYYLITKARYWQRPTYEDLRKSLQDMKRHCRENSVSRIAMPQIGCGLDGLSWSNVSDILHNVFKQERVTITIYTLRKTSSRAKT